MGDTLPVTKVAAVQAASVAIDREATTEKVCRFIEESAANGAKLVVFPEAFIPTYPYWIFLGSPTWWMPFYKELFLNAVEIPSETTDKLCRAAHKYGTYVAVGINERRHKALFNSLLFISPEGEIMGTHRKLEATFAEKMIWGEGDANTLHVFETDMGRLGGLICGEHMMDLARFALYTMHEQIHVAIWPGISAVKHNPRSSTFNNLAESAAIHHAVAGGVYVINAFSVVGPELIAKMGLQNRPDTIIPGGGRTAIIAPDGRVIGGPTEDRENIIYADLDLADAIPMSPIYGPVDLYARPEILSLRINRRPLSVVEEMPPEDQEEDTTDAKGRTRRQCGPAGSGGEGPGENPKRKMSAMTKP